MSYYPKRKTPGDFSPGEEIVQFMQKYIQQSFFTLHTRHYPDKSIVGNNANLCMAFS